MKVPRLALTVCVALFLSTVTEVAGDRCLFIGHSFFIPVAEKLPDLAALAGLNHSQNEVFSGGNSGTPLSLWNNAANRAKIKGYLNTGQVELLGMVYAPGDRTEGHELWIDYALSQNPDTKFMVGAPWLDFPESFNTTAYTSVVRTLTKTTYPAVLASLRAKYPGVTIVDNPYSLGTVELRLLFDAGQVPDVLSLTGDDRATSIFYDQKGHGGDILLDLLSLFFVNRIYGVECDRNPFKWSTNLAAVAQSVLDAYDAGSLCGTAACSLAASDAGTLTAA